MSERATHSPGDWTYSYENHGLGSYFREWFHVKADDGSVARVGIFENKDKGEANARLIAAAPALLSVLQRLMEKWDDETALQPRAMLVKEARIEIAKATGEQLSRNP